MILLFPAPLPADGLARCEVPPPRAVVDTPCRRAISMVRNTRSSACYPGPKEPAHSGNRVTGTPLSTRVATAPAADGQASRLP